jgi:hypothetical protein
MHGGMQYDLKNYERTVGPLGRVSWRETKYFEILSNGDFVKLLEQARREWLKKTEPSKMPPKDPFDQTKKGVSPKKKEDLGLKRDVVDHYTAGKTETIDYIFEQLGYEGGMAYIIGNLIKYSSRANHKGQRKSDINKIRNYSVIALEKMAEEGDID